MSQAIFTSTSTDGHHVYFKLRKEQLEILKSLNRFNVLLAHRRFGKTVLAIWVLITKALSSKQHRPQTHYFCPTYAQAKRVAWAYLRDYAGAFPGTEFNESELKCTFRNGAIIQLGSADNPDSSRGIYSDFVVLDEPAQMPSRFWSEVLRPALSDRKGGALMIGTPAGRNGLFYDSYQEAEHLEDWWRGTYKASDTGIVDAAELVSAQKAMTVNEYAQEYECSWDAAIRGAYWAEAMQAAEADGRIGKFAAVYSRPVHISLDLGMNDATACWFFQLDGDEIRVVDFAEYTNMGLPDIVNDWKARKFVYGKVIAPPDVNVRSLSTGQTRRQTLQDLGVDVLVAPAVSKIDGIEAVRGLLQRCRFHVEQCADGIEALRQYRADWEDKKGVLRLQPLHDWTSHAADALRYLAVTGTDQLVDRWGGAIDYSQMDRLCA